MNTTISTLARTFFSFASIALMSASGLGGCVAAEEDMADFGDEMEGDEMEEEVSEDSEALCSPPAKVYINADFNSLGQQEGRYNLGTGAAGGACWIHERASSTSNYSIGAVGGTWYLFSNGNCAQTGVPMSLGLQTTCAPTTTMHVKPAPKAVRVDTNSIPGGKGLYAAAGSTGISSAGCWNQVGGNKSLGSYSGYWFIFPGLDCATPSFVYPIGQAFSVDPTEKAPVIEISYELYSAWPW